MIIIIYELYDQALFFSQTVLINNTVIRIDLKSIYNYFISEYSKEEFKPRG